MKHSVTVEFGGRPLTIETGEVAKQTSGAVMVRYGDTMSLVTAVAMPEARPDTDFMPLTVNYQEKFYATGKIPGNFFRREARPTDKETLTSRLIDRPIRPLMPDNWRFDTQIIATVMSADGENEPDGISMIGASAALMVSDIHFAGPIAGVRVGRVGGELIANPTPDQMAESDIDLFLAGSKKAIVMVEAGAQEVSEQDMLDALEFGHKSIQPVLEAQEELARKVNKPKRELPEVVDPLTDEDRSKFEGLVEAGLNKALSTTDKIERYANYKTAKSEALAQYSEEELAAKGKALKAYFDELKAKRMRGSIVNEGKRIDGRDLVTVRPINIEVGLLPRAHGSVLFTRGETQSIVTTTLGTSDDEQRLDQIEGMFFKRFMLHYNFPPYSVGETSFRLGPGRREIGHGTLAERAIKAVLPHPDDFSYAIRVVSEITESNGSSSMATVCGGSLSLMDAGVPIRAAVAGVAMGLIQEGDKTAVLTDILGDEDHLGDMDFKVAGTENGITALQMDIKIEGLSSELMHKAMEQAREARLHILGKMNDAISAPREDISQYAPRITTIQIPVDRIRDVIGSGGKVIKEIIAKTGCSINIQDDGSVSIASSVPENTEQAIQIIKELTREAELGMVYKGKATRIVDFGAFIELIPGLEGLLHVSEIDFGRVANPGDVIKEGDEVVVKVVEIDQQQGRIRLSRKAVLYMDPEELPFQDPVPPTEPPAEFRAKLEEDAERRASRGNDRGGRGGPRGGDRGGDRGGRGGGRRR